MSLLGIVVRGIWVLLVAGSLAGEAAAQATVHGDCSKSIAAIIAKRNADNKVALIQRNKRFKKIDQYYQKNVEVDLDAQFKKWLRISQAIIGQVPITGGYAGVAQRAGANKKLAEARNKNLKAQQEILLKWRTLRSERMKVAQKGFEKAVLRNNTVAQNKIERFRKKKCVERQ